MRPIDAHVHVGKWALPEFSARATDLSEANSLYLRFNWAGALVFPTDLGLNAELLEEAAAIRGPVGIRVAFWADFRDADNLAMFSSRTDEFAALKIHPSCIKTPADSADWEPYYELAEAAGLPVVVHCGRWQEVAGYALALEAAGRFPRVNFILAHMGGDSPHLVTGATSAVAAGGYDNVYFGTESIREPWLLEQALARVGSTRLIFGSDYNLNHPEPFRRLIEVLDITDRDRSNIFRRNINSLLPSNHTFVQP